MNIIVAGTGTAGLLSASILKHTIPDANVTIIDGGDGVIGVGEGTFGSFIETLRDKAGVNIFDLVNDIDPVAKYGVELDFGKDKFHYTFDRVFDWWYKNEKLPVGFNFEGGNYGNSPFSNNMINKSGIKPFSNQHALHLNNEKWLVFMRKHAKNLGVNIIKDNITSIERTGDIITSINNKYKADYYIDCTGFKGLLTKSKWMPFKKLINDRALFFITENDHPIRPYTVATTMNSGWFWEIDHMNRTGNGYVYSSKFITDEEAKNEIECKLGKNVNGKVIKFRTGRRDKQWEGNVITIGNSGNFIEPLESTSIDIILHNTIGLSNILKTGVNDYMIDRYNKEMNERLDNMADFIAIHFIYNKKLDTDYWKYYNKLNVDKGTLADDIIEYYRHNNTNIVMTTKFYSDVNPFGVEGWYSILRGLDVN